MNTRGFAILTCLVLLHLFHGYARPVTEPDLKEISEKADLVAILEPLSTTNATDAYLVGGGAIPISRAQDYQALNTQFKIHLILKRNQAAQAWRGWRTDTLTVLHFTYVGDSPLDFNVPVFAYFALPPLSLSTAVSSRHGPVIAQGAPRYLAFLRCREDGRFEPVTDQYESGFSFRVLTTPTLGEMHYYLDRSRDGRHDGQPVDPANGSQPIRSETNRTSVAAGSRR